MEHVCSVRGAHMPLYGELNQQMMRSVWKQTSLRNPHQFGADWPNEKRGRTSDGPFWLKPETCDWCQPSAYG